MGFTQKSGPANALAIVGQIPQPPPKVPPEMIRRFPDWEAYDKGMQEWWGRFSDMFQRDRSQLQSLIQTDDAASKANTAIITAIQTSLADVLAQLGTLTSSSPLAALVAQVAAIVSGLAQHIAATVVHGTASAVVGVTDAQNLERKNIGLTIPGYGRFLGGALGLRTIPVTTTLTVGPSDFLVTAGPLDIEGGLVVAGTLLSL